MSRILAVVAHADDELLGCGGTLRRHVLEGDTVYVAIAADCRTARDPSRSPELSPAACQVAARLGFHHPPIFLGYPGMELAASPELDRNRRVETVVRGLCPHVVYTHHVGDINSDHRAVAAAVAVACRPVHPWTPRRLLAFETPSSTEWGSRPFEPSVFCDIEGEPLTDKLAALALYDEETRPAPHPRNPEMLTARAAYWGQISGLAAAEPFVLLREVR